MTIVSKTVLSCSLIIVFFSQLLTQNLTPFSHLLAKFTLNSHGQMGVFVPQCIKEIVSKNLVNFSTHPTRKAALWQ